MGAIVRRGSRHAPRFFAQYRDADGVRRTKLLRGATTVEHARGLLSAIELNITQGRAGLELPTEEQQAQASLTVRELGAMFVERYTRPGLSDLDSYQRQAKSKLKRRINPLLGSRAAASLKVGDIERFRDMLAGKPHDLAPASITRTLAVLSKAYNWARRAGVLECANPVQGVERPRAPSSLDFLARGEAAALLAQAEQLGALGVASWAGLMLHPMVATALYTGMRLGELHGLTWSAVHFDGQRIDVLRSYRKAPKSGEKRHLPLHPDLAPVLRAWKKRCPASTDGLVFPVEGRQGFRMGSASSLRGLLQALLGGAGCHVPEKPWHALRHTYASHAVMAGVPLYTLQKLLGHSTPVMTQRYSHLAPDHLAAEVARLTFAAPAPSGLADFGEEVRKRATATRPGGQTRTSPVRPLPEP